MEKKTPLYDYHVENGGKVVPFAGYLLPVQYESGVIAEHMATRTSAGIFDVSHMGEVVIAGKDALAAVNYLMTNDFTNMDEGQVRYTTMCNFDGGVVDDLLVYKFNTEKFLLVINASNREKDFNWIKNNIKVNATASDISDSCAQIALQGPKSRDIILKLALDSDIPKKYYTFTSNVKIADCVCDISRTGYTGEYGYEIICKPEEAVKLWLAISEAGKEFGLLNCGLGARDTLRLEAGMPLYGHEMTDTISPLEACLNFAVKLDKADFIGKAALVANPPKRERVGLKVIGRGIIREHSDVTCDGVLIGQTTSGTHCPYLGYAVAAALVNKGVVKLGDKLDVDVRGRKVLAEVIPFVFYKRQQ